MADSVSVPIVKNGKDLCRMVFTDKSNGLYDVKIDFLKQPFIVLSYPVFSLKPNVQSVANPKDADLSYHPANMDKPSAIIHIKDKSAGENKQTYYDVLVSNLKSPSVNNHFPMPLLKIAFPKPIIDGAKPVKNKKKYHKIDLGKYNIIEVYIESLGMVDINNYEKLRTIQYLMPIDYFASDSVLTDYQKNRTAWMNNGPFIEVVSMGIVGKMRITAIMYSDERIDTLKDIEATFIENEYAEDILLTTLVRKNEEGHTVIGSANLKQLEIPANTSKIDFIEDSATYWSSLHDNLSQDEIASLLKWQIASRKRLSNALMSRKKMELN